MSAGYRAILWNRQKRIYDSVLAASVGAFLLVFAGLSLWLRPGITAETLLIRAFGSAALVCLHVVLVIGPLCRLDRRFLPLLYNRRHLGVTTFLLGAIHAGLATVQFHALGNVSPLVSLFTANPRFDSLAQFPFQILGAIALVILFLMAATSHDFWLHQLTAPVWKALHMAVYAAYALLVLHVTLGVLQGDTGAGPIVALAAGLVGVLGLHVVAGWRERAGDRESASGGWIPVAPVTEMVDGEAKVVTAGDERVAVFRDGDRIHAVSNVCQHQNGPLGEGRILDGCITCPWHGYQYDPATGTSPPPFTERIPIFAAKVEEGRVWIDPQPRAAGTPLPEVRIGARRG